MERNAEVLWFFISLFVRASIKIQDKSTHWRMEEMWSHHLDILFMENNRYTMRSICKELNGLIIFYMQCVLYHDKPSLFSDNQQHLITTIHSLLTVVKRIFLSKNRLFWSNLQNIGKCFLSIVVPCDGQYRFLFSSTEDASSTENH